MAVSTFVGDTRVSACFDLRDHIVDMYADEYLSEQHADPSPLERQIFHAGWRETLAKMGALDRFELSCITGLTERQYHCGMATASVDALAACMKS